MYECLWVLFFCLKLSMPGTYNTENGLFEHIEFFRFKI